ncbi:uncharacterized protein A1O9_07250 [Exophiala aquamarina CBS 119918]|uniref:Uncharacterized protein n=1 Tax=Exophiala aquamarina CBS 119918 TaxID=1182545 RepID=A0A072PNE6_9EURO|nr:uncharacterized protein A1O9_07250 [Exophiala aquamarina CBS 119918]KEF57060.1 hypothetical protein A1O9_07250 [Exophiala aquamarina CBS 119918]
MSACHSEPAILHAALAVAGAHKAYCDRQSAKSGMIPVTSSLATSIHLHYQKALSYLRRRIAVPSPECPEIVLIVCLVLLTFDMIEGRYGEALLHLTHGRRIVKDLNDSSSSDSHVPLSLPPVVTSAMDEIKYSFAMMDIQSVNFGSLKPHFKLVADTNLDGSPRLEIPASFTNFDDAWRYLLLLLNKCYRLFAAINELGSKKYDLPTDELVFRSERSSLLEDVEKWKDAFDKSSFRILSSGQSPLASKSTLLRLHHLTLCICVKASFNLGDEMFFDVLVPDFLALVGFCEDLLPNLPTISIETGIIQPLFLTGCLCRHPGIRRRLVRLLSHPRKEGHWDSKLIEIISRERMIFEEELAGYVHDDRQSLPDDVDLAQLIPREARWSESWIFFVKEDYSMVEITFRRKKRHPHLLLDGEDDHETRKKLVTFE